MDVKTCRIGGTIAIGYTPENNARQIRFDLSKWLSAWPGAEATLLAVRPGESEAYPAKTEMDGTTIVWTVGRYDTAIPGVGEMWVVFRDADGETLGLTPRSSIMIQSGPPNIDGETPPEGAIPWVEDVLDAADRAEQSAKKAEEIVGSLAGGGGNVDSGLFLPGVTEDDNGKVLTVVGGKWAAAELPKYDGAYEVKPLAGESTTLLTAQKFMTSDVVVTQIPYGETSNASGGETAYIGMEVEIYGD